MKSVTYKELIIIDGKEYLVYETDHTESVQQAIDDGVLRDEHEQIYDYVHDDVLNHEGF